MKNILLILFYIALMVVSGVVLEYTLNRPLEGAWTSLVVFAMIFAFLISLFQFTKQIHKQIKKLIK